MRSHMEEVAKMFGVELRETFKIADDIFGEHPKYYRFAENVCLEASNDGGYWETADAGVLEDILMGDVRIVKLPWKPKYDEKYYIPSISNAFGYNSFYWKGDDSDEKYYNFGIICKSKEEAIALRQKMLAVAKEKNE